MEVLNTQPGTTLLLEPGGLDGPSIQNNKEEDEVQDQLQPINENIVTNISNTIIEQNKEQNKEEEDNIQINNNNNNEEEEEEEKEDEYSNNRVIVRKRNTKGVGFFSRRKENIIIKTNNNNEEEGKNNQIGGGGIEWQPLATNVKPGYSSFKSGIIKLTPESLKCKLYCRGSKCIYCNPENWNENQQAIFGVYSNWIGENILAMARPTERTFNEFKLIEQFIKTKIKTLINLQCVNEHDFCGQQLITNTGFSYNPELLMNKQIYYYNFAIPDFGTISVNSILNIVKIIWFSLKKGRVAIHCHAGLGRTGTLIACFLVWAKGINNSDAIDFVRNARPNSIQSLEQINAVEEFSYYVYKNGTALPNSLFMSNNGIINLRQLLLRQCQFLPNEQARRFAHVPKLIFMIGDCLLRNVFGLKGIYYAPLTNNHHARSCTFGTIHVNWKNAFTPNGKLQVRQVVSLLARCLAFPYEKDQIIIEKFQQISMVTIDNLINELNISQLV
ncbi:TYR_PHOSPHATASE_2 domain-containing protein [Meloidogyne graminicola]|uniref:TYR_PHOSPHATASE_2 domain-containing protein n=1 Tax=Meloidogyne graminicola TaxID=189291 RepID=A0A8S9ZQ52_9BILA|nr:TYR_PHOSPHATASE_2 domain-containing protein [Meloidogyne graminicola]